MRSSDPGRDAGLLRPQLLSATRCGLETNHNLHVVPELPGSRAHARSQHRRGSGNPAHPLCLAPPLPTASQVPAKLLDGPSQRASGTPGSVSCPFLSAFLNTAGGIYSKSFSNAHMESNPILFSKNHRTNNIHCDCQLSKNVLKKHATVSMHVCENQAQRVKSCCLVPSHRAEQVRDASYSHLPRGPPFPISSPPTERL